jgi:hypothetical protein
MKTPKKVDSLIVGGGLVGLRLLKKLKDQGEKVLLVEKTNDIGGTTATVNLDSNQIKLNSLIWMEDSEASIETFTLGKKGLTPFLGFGDYKGNILETAESFTKANSKPLRSIDLNLNDNEPFKTLTQVTKIIQQDQEGQNFCELNGKDFIQYNRVFWCASMDELLKVMPKDSLIELKQKASKAKKFDGMTLQFEGDLDQFKEHQNSKFILFGEDETPWMGAILEDQILTFTTFYSYTLSQDHDFIRRHLKSLKRQVRKIFPELYSEDQINTFSTDRLTLHTNVLNLLSLSTKAQKELAPLVFCGSHKEHYPKPFETKFNFAAEPEMPGTQADSEDPELALTNPL